MPTPLDAADALEALLPAIAEICDIMRDAPAEIRERARPWLSCLDRATGTESTVTIEDTIAELRAIGDVGADHRPGMRIRDSRGQQRRR